MSTLAAAVEKHHNPIIIIMGIVIPFFVLACILDNVIPVCHYIFRCDDAFHG